MARIIAYLFDGKRAAACRAEAATLQVAKVSECRSLDDRLVKTFALASLAPGGLRARASEVDVHQIGALESDPQGILDLPPEFGYTVISTAGDEMDDGLLVPGRADGMAAFASDDGKVLLVCNHENLPGPNGPFGRANERLSELARDRIYDAGGGITPGCGGTTTLLYDPDERKTLRRHLSLAGTEVNCAGGPTPWGSWLSCEENFSSPGVTKTRRATCIETRGTVTCSKFQPALSRPSSRFHCRRWAVSSTKRQRSIPISGAVFLTETVTKACCIACTDGARRPRSRWPAAGAVGRRDAGV